VIEDINTKYPDIKLNRIKSNDGLDNIANFYRTIGPDGIVVLDNIDYNWNSHSLYPFLPQKYLDPESTKDNLNIQFYVSNDITFISIFYRL